MIDLTKESIARHKEIFKQNKNVDVKQGPPETPSFDKRMARKSTFKSSAQRTPNHKKLNLDKVNLDIASMGVSPERQKE